MSDQYLTIAEVAKVIGKERDAAGHLVRRGQIPGLKLHNRWAVLRSDAEAFVQRQTG